MRCDAALARLCVRDGACATPRGAARVGIRIGVLPERYLRGVSEHLAGGYRGGARREGTWTIVVRPRHTPWIFWDS